MAVFCQNCGAELPDGTAFCTECGTPVESSAVPEAFPVGLPAEPIPVNTGEPASEAPVSEPLPVPEHPEKAVKTGAYFWLMLLYRIPVIGLIAMVIMALVPKNKSLKNFSLANLILILVLLVLGLIILLALYFILKKAGLYEVISEAIRSGDWSALTGDLSV